jgi:hypothetical protein
MEDVCAAATTSLSTWESGHSIERLLIIDPGTANLGLVFVEINSTRKEFRKFMDVVSLDLSLGELKPVRYRDAFDQTLGKYCVQLWMHDYVIVEDIPSNFKKMRKLSDFLQLYFACTTKSHIHAISPLKWRKRMGMRNTGKHWQNKQETVDVIESRKDAIFGGKRYVSDIADCVAILNVFLETHKRLHKKLSTYTEVQ